ncbi:MAG: NDP-sugar synthase [Thaumarchaeota archaeon]|nr:NDP-sugar synthase [Nitrososphaerota archaeon]
MKAIILAGGQGLRLRPLTDDKPKPMVPVNGKPIAELQLNWLRRNHALEQIVFACGHRWEKLREHFGSSYEGVPVEYAVEESPLGTGGAIKSIIKKYDLQGDVLVMNGDMLTDLPLERMLDTYRTTQAMATMMLVPYRSPYGVVHIDKLKMIRKFDEKPEFPDVWINGGIYVLDAKRIVGRLPDAGDIERETFPKLVTYGELSAHPYYGFWRVVDSIKDLRAVEEEMLAQEASSS